MERRKVVGTVDTSEFLVALGASAGFLIGLGRSEIQFSVVAAMLLGGVVAAPMAAWLVRIMHPRLLGAAVGGLIIFTNARSLLKATSYASDVRYLVLVCVAVISFGAIAIAVQSIAAERSLRQAGVAGH